MPVNSPRSVTTWHMSPTILDGSGTHDTDHPTLTERRASNDAATSNACSRVKISADEYFNDRFRILPLCAGCSESVISANAGKNETPFAVVDTPTWLYVSA